MNSLEPTGDKELYAKLLADLSESDLLALTAGEQREGWDLPVMVFWGFSASSLILSTLLALELWAGF